MKIPHQTFYMFKSLRDNHVPAKGGRDCAAKSDTSMQRMKYYPAVGDSAPPAAIRAPEWRP